MDRLSATRSSARSHLGIGAVGRLSVAVPVAVLIVSCAQLDGGRDMVPSDRLLRSTDPYVSGVPPEQVIEDEDRSADREPTLYPGNDRQLRMPTARPPLVLRGNDVSVNFEQAPLLEVVQAIMGEMLGLDYVIEHPVGGEITLRTQNPVPRQQLLEVLESLLRSNGVLMVRDESDRYYISASAEMPRLLPAIGSPESGGAGYSVTVVPLKFISAPAMADILRPIANEQAFVRVDASRNLLMLAGTRRQMQGWLEIVETFDIDRLAGMSVGVFPLEYSTVAEAEAALREILGGKGEGENAVADLITAVTVIPMDRLNSILVVTPVAAHLEQIRIWIDRLDRAPDSNSQQLWVYPVQNGTALDLARLLSTLYGGTATGARQPGAADSGVAPGLNPETLSGGGGLQGGLQSGGLGSGGRGGLGASSARGRSQQGGSAAVTLGDGVRVVADESNNALLLLASGREYREITNALKKLDIAPAQIIIEATILEVSLVDDLRYGVEWYIENSLRGNRRGGALLDLGVEGIAPRVPGFSYSIVNGAGELKGVINALAEDSLINVISTPSVMVLDNYTAIIKVGDQQPVQTAQTVTVGGNLTQSVEFKDTGVQLEVRPSANAGGLVSMDIQQSITDVGPVDTATGQRSFLQRDIASRVAVRSGESVVLGGLIRENQSRGRSGIPFLHQLPVVGALFGTNTRAATRTELLVIITPRVLFNEQDVRDVSREMRARMRGLELIGTGTGTGVGAGVGIQAQPQLPAQPQGEQP